MISSQVKTRFKKEACPICLSSILGSYWFSLISYFQELRGFKLEVKYDNQQVYHFF